MKKIICLLLMVLLVGCAPRLTRSEAENFLENYEFSELVEKMNKNSLKENKEIEEAIIIYFDNKMEDFWEMDQEEGAKFSRAILFLSEIDGTKVSSDYISKLDDLMLNSESVFSRVVASRKNYVEALKKLENKDFEGIDDYLDKIDPLDTFAINSIDKEMKKYEEFMQDSPIEVLDYSFSTNSIGANTLNVTVKNLGDQAIKEARVTVFLYDAEGYPLKTGVLNSYDSQTLKFDDTIKPGASKKGTYTIYGNQKPKKAIFVVKEVEFYDDTLYENYKYLSDVNKYEGKRID